MFQHNALSLYALTCVLLTDAKEHRYHCVRAAAAAAAITVAALDATTASGTPTLPAA